jgi:hypothetical protein
MSKTQARQIRFSTIDMDSAGKAEMSRGRSVSSFGAAGFRTEGCFRAGVRFTVFAVLAEALVCRGSLVTGLGGDFVFRGGMGLPLFRINRDSDESAEADFLSSSALWFFCVGIAPSVGHSGTARETLSKVSLLGTNQTAIGTPAGAENDIEAALELMLMTLFSKLPLSMASIGFFQESRL